MPERILNKRRKETYFLNPGVRCGKTTMPYSTVPTLQAITDESPIRTALPVSTLPPHTNPPIDRPGHASGTVHDPLCQIDLRNVLDVFIK